MKVGEVIEAKSGHIIGCRCPKCNWKGKVAECEIDDCEETLVHICPKCGEDIDDFIWSFNFKEK